MKQIKLTMARSEHIVKREAFNSRIQKRVITFSACTAAQTTTLKTSVTDAIAMAGKAFTAAATVSRPPSGRHNGMRTNMETPHSGRR
jgi:hypothetical protein